MSLTESLGNIFEPGTRYVDLPLTEPDVSPHKFEIWVHPDGAVYDWQEQLPDDELEDWLRRDAPQAHGVSPLGGMKFYIAGYPVNGRDRSAIDKNGRLYDRVNRVLDCFGIASTILGVLALDGGFGLRRWPVEAAGRSGASPTKPVYSIHTKGWIVAWSFCSVANVNRGVFLLDRHHPRDEFLAQMHWLGRCREYAIQPMLIPAIHYSIALGVLRKRVADVIQHSWVRVLGQTSEQLRSFFDSMNKANDLPEGNALMISEALSHMATSSVLLEASCKRLKTNLALAFEEAEASRKSYELAGRSELASQAKALLSILDFIDREAEREQATGEGFKGGVALQQADLYGMLSQRDQQIGLAIAKASQTLAEESRKDHTSMTIIAAVTMVFLPGTFVATFFDMPLFRWEADSAQGESVLTERFWVYWAVAAPLTGLTIALWYIFFRVQSARTRQKSARRKNEASMEPLPDPLRRAYPRDLA